VESDPTRACPFCPGNEESTPPALETYGPGGDWLVRVVLNLFPAFYGEEQMAVTHLGPVWSEAPAGGIHEILVFSPNHSGTWAGLGDEQAGLVMNAIHDRMRDHSSRSGLRYTQVIVNFGREAGASLEHPHGQLLAVPFVPGEIVEEVRGFSRFGGGCLLCTTIEAETSVGHRVVIDHERVTVVAPYWSGSPYEMLVIPRACEEHLHEAAPRDLAAVGRAIRDALARLQKLHGDLAYNIVFHTAPFAHDSHFHWHAHLVPKLTTQAGFELGTGVMINIVAPEQAAQELRDIETSTR